MKNLKDLILEKILINKNISIKFNPDDLNNDNVCFYSDQDEDKQDVDYLDSVIDNINDEFNGFLVCRYKPLSAVKNFYENNIISDYSDDLTEIKDRIITGKDHGYEVNLVAGHLEFNCINSGSRGIYYVYALSDDAYIHVEDWFQGLDYIQELSFLMKSGNVLEIKKDLLTL